MGVPPMGSPGNRDFQPAAKLAIWGSHGIIRWPRSAGPGRGHDDLPGRVASAFAAQGPEMG